MPINPDILPEASDVPRTILTEGQSLTAQIPTPREIPTQVDDLSRALTLLYETVETLEERLDSVLQPASDQAQPEAPMMSKLTHLGAGLASLTDRAHRTNTRLLHIIERLEL